MNRRRSIFAICVLAIGLQGETCDTPFGKGGAAGQGGAIQVITDPDSRCVSLADAGTSVAFSLGIHETAWALTPGGGRVSSFDVQSAPPTAVAEVATAFGLGGKLFPLTDGSGKILSTSTDGVSGDEEVRRLDPLLATPAFETFRFLSTHPNFSRITPGTGVSISTLACHDAAAGETDSTEMPIMDGGCDTGSPGFETNLTSAATIVGDHLFVTTQNLGPESGEGEPQYFPGTVLVYELNSAVSPVEIEPDPISPLVVLEGFNPTGVVPLSHPLLLPEEYVLVLVSGAVAAVAVEGAPTGVTLFESRTPASLQVINVGSLEVVATLPLTVAPIAGLLLHPSGEVAVTGSLNSRTVYAFDLDELAAQVDAGIPTLTSSVLLPSTGFAPRTTSADDSYCPGLIAGLAINDSGDKLFATDFCDGIVGVIGLDAASDPPSFSGVVERIFAAERIDQEEATAVKGLSSVAVRPDGHSDAGADVFVLINQPEGMMCGLDIDTGPS
jgi:hypothetical protein